MHIEKIGEANLVGPSERSQPAAQTSAPKYPPVLYLKADGRIHFVRASEIRWVKALRNYVEVRYGKTTLTVRSTMQGLTKMLDPNALWRVHRSYLVNAQEIAHVKTGVKASVIMRDGVQIPIGRCQRKLVAGRCAELNGGRHMVG
jgi:DNA-binding LytR/AlgR family response regulator